MKIINSIITNTNDVMYGYLLLAVFFVISVFFTIRLRGIQISHSIHALKLLFSKHEKVSIKTERQGRSHWKV